MKNKIKKLTTILVLLAIFSPLVLVVQPLDPNTNLINIGLPKSSQTEEHKFTYGYVPTMYQENLDPAASWYVDIFDQCLETLFSYNLTRPGAPLISRLAKGYHWVDNMTLDVYLHEDVKFHDETDFNASSVVWNINRTYNIIHNHNDMWEYNFRIDPEPFRDYVDLSWVPEGGLVDIVNRTLNITNHKVRFELNVPYIPFIHLLASPGTYMLSPTAHKIDENRVIGNVTDKLIGTGPFRFINHTHSETPSETPFIASVTNFTVNDNYWRKKAYITDLTFIAYYNQTELDNAIKNGEVDFAERPSLSLKDDPELNPNMEIIEGGPTYIYYYLGLSNINLDLPVRKAIAYAYDYNYTISTIYNDEVVRSRGPIPAGIKYYNESIPTIPTNDPNNVSLMTARQTLIDAFPDECAIRNLDINNQTTEWIYIAQTNPITTVNYTYNEGNQNRKHIGEKLKGDLSEVGIELEIVADEWWLFWEKITQDYSKLETFMSGWGPDFLDPANYIIPLFSNMSPGHSVGYDNETTQEWMYKAVMSTDESEIRDYYNKIQKQLQMETHPWAFLFQPKNINAINISWTGMPTGTYDRRPYFYYAYEESSGWVPGEDIYAYIEIDTPSGTDIIVTDPVSDISLEFKKVDVAGTSVVSISEIEPDPEEGFDVLGTYYNINSTVAFTGNVIVGMPYDDSIFEGDEDLEEDQVFVMHYDENSNKWRTAVRDSIDTLNNIIYVRVSSFSIFAVMRLEYVAADIVLEPATLNLRSKGSWITVYIELFEGFDVNNIDITTIRLNEEIPAETSPVELGDFDGDGIPDLMVKFDRVSVYSVLTVGDAIEVVITGNLLDGKNFYGTDILRVIGKGMDHYDESDPSSIQYPNLISPFASIALVLSSIFISLINKKLKILTGNKSFFKIN